jgi:hypothetical protein
VVRILYGAELADPLVDVRDVVESFRSFGVAPADWHRALDDAAAVLDQLPADKEFRELFPDLVPNIRILLSNGLSSVPDILEEVAEQVAAALSQTRVPGIPRPEEDDWDFGKTTGS